MLLWLRLVFFTILVPGTVAGYIPYRLVQNTIPDWDLPALKWSSIFIIIIGIGLYVACALTFLLKGKGTPTIWFARSLKFIIGEEPVKMVASGLYKYSRNPMYLAVILTVLGQAFFFQRIILLHYLLFLVIFFHLVVTAIEEPHLKKKYGKEYEEYKKKTRRWF